uniref:Uncharacterized protein n=1 Tax=Timema bartmani TaxID=61472 RepID=A0A7R9EWY6_9NEOP|nr:unnamed protein product [Timema bartmani]
MILLEVNTGDPSKMNQLDKDGLKKQLLRFQCNTFLRGRTLNPPPYWGIFHTPHTSQFAPVEKNSASATTQGSLRKRPTNSQYTHYQWETRTPNRDLNLNIPVIGSLVYCKSSVLDHAPTEVTQPGSPGAQTGPGTRGRARAPLALFYSTSVAAKNNLKLALLVGGSTLKPPVSGCKLM